MAKWLSVRLRTKWFWVRVQLQSLDLATIDEIKKDIIGKQKIIKKRYNSILEIKKTIQNNIDLVYNALKKLPNESQPKLIELVRLDTILNNSINVIWREIYEIETFLKRLT